MDETPRAIISALIISIESETSQGLIIVPSFQEKEARGVPEPSDSSFSLLRLSHFQEHPYTDVLNQEPTMDVSSPIGRCTCHSGLIFHIRLSRKSPDWKNTIKGGGVNHPSLHIQPLVVGNSRHLMDQLE